MSDESDDLVRGLRRALAEPGDDVDRRLRGLGLLYAGVPEPAGAGGDPGLPLVVVEECARSMAAPAWTLTGPLAAQTLSGWAPDDLDPVLAGSLRTGVCWPGVLGPEGTVLAGADVDRVITVSTRADGSAEVTVADPVGGGRESLAALDPSRPLARVAHARTVTRHRLDAFRARRLRAFWLLAVAADSLGSMQQCLEITLAHVRERQAFGRAIGAFQAVRHRCAELYVDVEATRASVVEGRLAWAAGAEATVEALVAAAQALDAAVRVAEGSVHLHGAMGFTRDAAPQAHLRRAYSMQALAVGARTLRQELATA